MKMTICPKCKGKGAIEDFASYVPALRERRKKLRKGLAQVAGQMGISVTYLHDLEHRQRAWNAELISKYKKAIA